MDISPLKPAMCYNTHVAHGAYSLFLKRNGKQTLTCADMLGDLVQQLKGVFNAVFIRDGARIQSSCRRLPTAQKGSRHGLVQARGFFRPLLQRCMCQSAGTAARRSGTSTSNAACVAKGRHTAAAPCSGACHSTCMAPVLQSCMERCRGRRKDEQSTGWFNGVPRTMTVHLTVRQMTAHLTVVGEHIEGGFAEDGHQIAVVGPLHAAHRHVDAPHHLRNKLVTQYT